MNRHQTPWMIKREVLIKAEERDSGLGERPEERHGLNYLKHGIINLDKTAGPSSHEVTAWVKRILGINHAGHGGTLEA